MRYTSTRGENNDLNFKDILIAGLASDGGLYMPAKYPKFSPNELYELATLSYPELSAQIIAKFIDDGNDNNALLANINNITNNAYDSFAHQAVTPLYQLSNNEWLLELFHGTTLAFKDVAMQFIGQALAAIWDDITTQMSNIGKKPVVIAATSGDTGSAAISGLKSCSELPVVILHPHNRPSEIQRRQMTTELAPNIHNIAVEGSFDDCQNIVKHMFNDPVFTEQFSPIAVNSINWARIAAQIVYYFYAGLSLGSPARNIVFVVPTGNFGDIFAGFVAKRMGLPIKKLIIASNQNDILPRAFATGSYHATGVSQTHSPSMDIQISSNFERLLFESYNRDSMAITALMADFKKNHKVNIDDKAMRYIKDNFAAGIANDTETIEMIRQIHHENEMIVDPHTAVGIAVGRKFAANNAKTISPDSDDIYSQYQIDKSDNIIYLATAHPAKFPDAIKTALNKESQLPEHIEGLFSKQERFKIMNNSYEEVRDEIMGFCR